LIDDPPILPFHSTPGQCPPRRTYPIRSAPVLSWRFAASIPFSSEGRMSIPKVEKRVLDYLGRFDLGAIGQTRDGRLISTMNPEGCLQAWWLQACDAGAVLAKARQDGDVRRAAGVLGVKLAPHDFVMQHTEKILTKLDARMRAAQQSGSLKEFNITYRERRQAAFREGKNFMSYSAARSPLRKAMVEAAAGKAAPGFIRKVFD
jgi:hypothetical protein